MVPTRVSQPSSPAESRRMRSWGPSSSSATFSPVPLFAKYQGDFTKLNRILDAYEPAANRIANTVAVGFVQERDRVIRQQQEAASSPRRSSSARAAAHPADHRRHRSAAPTPVDGAA